MKAKHLTKNTMSHKLVFLAVGIAIAIIAAFSICATGTAIADSNNQSNDTISRVIVTDPGSAGKPHAGAFADWHDPKGPSEGEIIEWESGLDVITKYAAGHNVISMDFCVVDSNGLIISLFDDGGKECDLVFFAYKSAVSSWYVGSEKVPSSRTSLDKNATFTYTDKAPTVSYNISGQVADADGLPVSGATVEFSSKAPVNAFNLGGRSTTTGADGKFTLSDIPEDEFPGYITITKDGFEPYTSKEITKDQAKSGDIDLSDIKLTPKEPIPPSPDPTPEPTPNTNATVSGGTPQTGDDASAAFALLGLLMLAGSGVLIGRKLYVK